MPRDRRAVWCECWRTGVRIFPVTICITPAGVNFTGSIPACVRSAVSRLSTGLVGASVVECTSLRELPSTSAAHRSSGAEAWSELDICTQFPR